MIHNRYKQDLLERRKECVEFKALALKAEDIDFVEDCDLWIANYDKLLQEADVIPEGKKLYYQVQEKLDQRK